MFQKSERSYSAPAFLIESALSERLSAYLTSTDKTGLGNSPECVSLVPSSFRKNPTGKRSAMCLFVFVLCVALKKEDFLEKSHPVLFCLIKKRPLELLVSGSLFTSVHKQNQ